MTHEVDYHLNGQGVEPLVNYVMVCGDAGGGVSTQKGIFYNGLPDKDNATVSDFEALTHSTQQVISIADMLDIRVLYIILLLEV